MQSNGFANTDTQTYILVRPLNTSRPTVTPTFRAPVGNEHRKSGQHRPAHAAARPLWLLQQAAHVLMANPTRRSRWPITWLSAIASCLTKSLKLSRPSELSVNVDGVSPGSALQIALVDDACRPLAGYTAELGSNSLKLPVAWAGGKTVLL